MVYITQLIYIVPGMEDTFHQFEDVTIPIISKYNGRLLLRTRPNSDTIIELHINQPYEIHLVSFDSQGDFDAFKMDEERKRFLHLKEKSIKTSLMIQGTRL